MVNYPTSLDNDSTLYLVADHVDDYEAVHHNSLKDAIIAVQTAVGITGAFKFTTDSEFSDHLSDTSTHGKSTIAGMEDLHPEDHDNIHHTTNYATATDLTNHTGAGNPHSSSASDTDLSNHAGATTTHGKTTIAGMEDLHTEAHVLATTGPHTGTLPLADLAVGSSGSIIRRGAADWEELVKGSDDEVLTLVSGEPEWAAGGSAPVLRPYQNLVTINNKPATLLFEDSYEDYPTTYDEDLPPFWKYHHTSQSIRDVDDYLKLDNVNFGGHDGMKLRWSSRSDQIITVFELPIVSNTAGLVIKFKNFYYDDTGVADRFDIYIYAKVWDSSAGIMVFHAAIAFIGEHNVYYHYPNGVKINTGWGNPETLGYHDLTFFLLPMTKTGLPIEIRRSPYRIECTGKTAVKGHRDDIFNDVNDTFMGWKFVLASPYQASGWDIDAYLRGIEIYARANEDLITT